MVVGVGGGGEVDGGGHRFGIKLCYALLLLLFLLQALKQHM